MGEAWVVGVVGFARGVVMPEPVVLAGELYCCCCGVVGVVCREGPFPLVRRAGLDELAVVAVGDCW